MENEPQLRPRDRLLRDSFTPAESLLFGLILVATTVGFWLADPRSIWGLGFFLIAGGFCPVILKTHQHTHPFFIDLLWPKFWIFSAPMWLLALQFTIGLIQDPVHTIEIGKEQFLTLGTIHPEFPVSTTTHTTWITVLGFCALYLIALNLFIIPKSRSFFEKTLPWLCLSAVLVGIFGYVQKALDLQSPLLTKGTGSTDFFAFFPYDGHWAAFALLWSAVCTGMALLDTRYDNSPDFIQSTAPWFLTGAALLGASGFLVEARWPAAILLISFSGMLLLVSANFLTQSKDRHRNSIALVSGLLASGFFAAGIYRIFQASPQAESAHALRRAAIAMFKDSPVFGWGVDSFTQLIPFYGDDLLLGARYDRAASDVLQFAAEVGIVGIAIPLTAIVLLVYRYMKGKHDINLTNHMMCGCIGVTLLACCDTPFMSPAVFLSFFVVFFSALRWADLSRSKVDEVDAIPRPALVTPEAERRIPFFTEEYQEKEK